MIILFLSYIIQIYTNFDYICDCLGPLRINFLCTKKYTDIVPRSSARSLPSRERFTDGLTALCVKRSLSHALSSRLVQRTVINKFSKCRSGPRSIRGGGGREIILDD